MRPANAHDDDEGRAVVEVVFLAVLLLIPTVYVVICIFRIQAATFAVTQAAREVGRVMDTTADPVTGLALAHRITTMVLADQNVGNGAVTIAFAEPDQPCPQAARTPPLLAPGTEITVCVTLTIALPGVPSVLSGADNTVTGVYTLRVGDFREQR